MILFPIKAESFPDKNHLKCSVGHLKAVCTVARIAVRCHEETKEWVGQLLLLPEGPVTHAYYSLPYTYTYTIVWPAAVDTCAPGAAFIHFTALAVVHSASSGRGRGSAPWNQLGWARRGLWPGLWRL